MMRPDKSVIILELKVHFPKCKILNKNTLLHIETRLNAEMQLINLLEQSSGYTNNTQEQTSNKYDCDC